MSLATPRSARSRSKQAHASNALRQAGDRAVAAAKSSPQGVLLPMLLSFCFPERQENPDSLGRLELFAAYGPTDEEGCLRGGMNGHHRHTDQELAQMISKNCLEAVYASFERKPLEVVADSLHEAAMSQRCSEEDVTKMLRAVPRDAEQRMKFSDVQRVILAAQSKRLMFLRRRSESGKPLIAPKERPPKVPFHSETAHTLMRVTLKKTFASSCEQEHAKSKLLHSYATLCGSLQQQNQGEQLSMNVTLMRRPGSPNDRWDRYCAIRKTGRSSYVSARNERLVDPGFADGGLGGKHPGTASILAASASGSSAAMQLAA